jgi:hypothetical protein
MRLGTREGYTLTAESGVKATRRVPTAFERSACLSGRAPDVLGPRTLWSFADVELDAVTLTQILEPFAVHRTLMEKVLVPSLALDEPEALVDS